MSFITQDNNITSFGNFTNQNTKWKADGYLNLYLPTNGGGRRKLGAVKLYNNKPEQAELIQKLTDNPGLIVQLVESLELDFQPALREATEESAFALGN